MGSLYYYGGSVGVFTPVEKYLDHSPGYIGDPADATSEEGINCNRTICHNKCGDCYEQMLTGIDQSAYSKIERGERYLSFEQCRRVALALDTSMDYLAGLTDEKKPYPRRK